MAPRLRWSMLHRTILSSLADASSQNVGSDYEVFAGFLGPCLASTGTQLCWSLVTVTGYPFVWTKSPKDREQDKVWSTTYLPRPHVASYRYGDGPSFEFEGEAHALRSPFEYLYCYRQSRHE